MNKYIEGYRVDYRKFNCPICRRQVYTPKEGAEGFPDSFFVERLRDVLSRRMEDTDCHICNFKGEQMSADVFCLECKTNFCNNCASSHRESKVTAKHSLLTLNYDEQKAVRQHCCEKHTSEPVCFFCKECLYPICLACTVIDHAGHEIEAIQEVRQEFITECQNYIDKAENQLDDLSQKRDQLGKVEQEVIDKKESVRLELCAIADALIEQINKQKQNLLVELDDLFDYGTIANERERMDGTISTLKSAVDCGKAVLCKDLEPIAQLKAKAQVLSDLDESLQFEPYQVDRLADKSHLEVQFLSGESEVRLGRLVRTILPDDVNADPIIEYKVAEGGDALIQATSGPQTFVVKDEVRKFVRSVDALASLPTGELVVLSANSERRVQIYDMSGMLKFYFPARSVKLAQPTSLCVTDQHIAVTDLATHSVHVFNLRGQLDHVFGAGVLDRPWAITATKGGDFVIADPGKSRITIHSNSGDLLNVVHFQKKAAVPRFLATCGNTIYSVGQFGDDIKAWRFVDANLRVLGVIKVSATAASLQTSGVALSNVSTSVSSSHQSLVTAPTSPLTPTTPLTPQHQARLTIFHFNQKYSKGAQGTPSPTLPP